MRFIFGIIFFFGLFSTSIELTAQKRRTLQIDADTTTRPTTPLYGLAVVNGVLFLVPPTGNMVKVANINGIGISNVSGLSSVLAGKEPLISSGTTTQYWRGDKSWQTLNKSAVGLGNVDNTSDLSKPISTTTQTAINAKQATLVSGTNIKTIESLSLLGSGNVDITKAMVSLSNVDNTSDLSKPISTATAAALSGKEPVFSKNTGFNKNFGTTAGTVAQGNHGHALGAITGTEKLVEADTVSGRAVLKIPSYVADRIPDNHHLVIESDYVKARSSGNSYFDTLRLDYFYYNLLRDSIELVLPDFSDSLLTSNPIFNIIFFGSDSEDSLFVFEVDSMKYGNYTTEIIDSVVVNVDSVLIKYLSSILYFSDTVYYWNASSEEYYRTNYLSSDNQRSPFKLPAKNSPFHAFKIEYVISENKYYIR